MNCGVCKVVKFTDELAICHTCFGYACSDHCDAEISMCNNCKLNLKSAIEVGDTIIIREGAFKGEEFKVEALKGNLIKTTKNEAPLYLNKYEAVKVSGSTEKHTSK